MNATDKPPSTSGYSIPIGYLRAWITLLVVAHHSVLAYHPDAPKSFTALDGANRWWGAFPVVDPAKWQGFSLFVEANDMYFMALMFLLSGLFVWPSLRRKGAAGYARDRVLRLGLPFAIAAGLLAPIAYYTAYLQTGATGGWAGYWQVFTKPGVWASGPAWFLWVLLTFDLIVAGVTALRPHWGDTLGRMAARVQSPTKLFAALVVVASVAHLAFEWPFGGFTWWHWGPFYIQAPRVLLYFTYFVFGIALGAYGLDQGVLSPEGPLARAWKLWINIAPVAFVAAVAAIIAAFSVSPLPPWLHLVIVVVYTLAGVAMSLASISLFLRFARVPNPVFAALVPCAFGIYLVHYPIVSHLQYLFLGLELPGAIKGVLVTTAAVAISWGLVAVLRKVPGVARVI